MDFPQNMLEDHVRTGKNYGPWFRMQTHMCSVKTDVWPYPEGSLWTSLMFSGVVMENQLDFSGLLVINVDVASEDVMIGEYPIAPLQLIKTQDMSTITDWDAQFQYGSKDDFKWVLYLPIWWISLFLQQMQDQWSTHWELNMQDQ